MTTPEERAKRWRNLAFKVWAVIGILLLVGVGGWVLQHVMSALVPFGLGLVIVLLLRRPVDWLGERMPRQLAVAICYLTSLVVLGIAFAFLIPPIYAQIAQFIGQVPAYTQQAYDLYNKLIAGGAANTTPDWLTQAIVALRDQIVKGAGTWSSALASYAVSAGSSLANGLIGLVLAFIIGFYTLTDLPHLEREVYLIAGERFRDETEHAFRTITRVLGGWLRGTLITSSVVATLISIGLWIAGVPYALAIGVLGGMLNVVPYVGPALTALLAGAAGLFVSPMTAVWAVLVVFVVQQIDSLLVGPRVMSEQVDLHPLLVILALLTGAALFGVPGMVLSVPVAAVIKGLFVYWFEKRGEGDMFSSTGVLLRANRPECDDEGAGDGESAKDVGDEVAGSVAPGADTATPRKAAPKRR